MQKDFKVLQESKNKFLHNFHTRQLNCSEFTLILMSLFKKIASILIFSGNFMTIVVNIHAAIEQIKFNVITHF